MGVKRPLKSKSRSVDVYVELGRIVKSVGLKGELKVYPLTRTPYELNKYPSLILRSEFSQLTEMTVETLRVQKQFAIIKFKDIDHIDNAEEFVGHEVGIYENQLPETKEGEYYIRDLIGMDVYTQAGDFLGVLSDVLEMPANDIYQVDAGDREYLIPALAEIITKVDLVKRIVTVRLIEGLIDSQGITENLSSV